MLTFNTELEFEELELCMRRYIYSTSIDVVKYCSITLFPHNKILTFVSRRTKSQQENIFKTMEIVGIG